jgi:ribonuclease J
MRVTLHRGSKEIGGSCVELAVEDGRLILDLGLPLVDADGEPFEFRPGGRSAVQLVADGVLPDVEGLYAHAEPSVAGVVISHGHQDHYGLAGYLHPDVPVYASEGTSALIRVTEGFLGRGPAVQRLEVLARAQGARERYEAVDIGPFRVQPFTVDHSAPDATALAVSAGGKTVLYSGDLRCGGRTAFRFDNLLRDAPKGVDALVLEGTTLGSPESPSSTELDVEQRMTEVLATADDLALLFCSSQNLDRLVSAYKAARRNRRALVIDLYTAYVLRRLASLSSAVPQFHWPGVRVLYTWRHARRLADMGHREFLFEVARAGARVRPEEITGAPQRFFVLARAGRSLDRICAWARDPWCIVAIWSMWEGYLQRDTSVERTFDALGARLHRVHTSGHASADQLRELVATLAPRRVVPIHTFRPRAFAGFHHNARPVQDGTPFEV